MSERPIPGRSYVSKRAIVEVVRAAVLESYGVTGFADPDLGGRLLRWLHLRTSGIRLNLSKGMEVELYLTVAYGVPIAEVARQVDSAVRYAPAPRPGARGRRAGHPRRWPPVPAGPAACHRPRRRVRRRSGRWSRGGGGGAVTRRSCDGAGLLAAFRDSVASIEAHVDELNALNVYPVPDGDTGSNMLATVRAALEEA